MSILDRADPEDFERGVRGCDLSVYLYRPQKEGVGEDIKMAKIECSSK